MSEELTREELLERLKEYEKEIQNQQSQVQQLKQENQALCETIIRLSMRLTGVLNG
mgnify:CR=1 FL=1